MARNNNTILSPGASVRESTAPMIDLRQGGQNGFMTDPASAVGAGNYARRNIIPILLESPSGFNDLPNPEYWHGTLKALVETQAQTIEGLSKTLTVEFAETPVGGAGEMQEDVVNVTRQRSVPAFTFPEKYNKPVTTFFEGWIQYLLGDAETKIPWVAQLADKNPSDFLSDYVGMTMLFIEPDPTHRYAIEAWLVSNMMPKTGGVNDGRREVAAAMEVVQHSIEFTGRTEVHSGVLRLAQQHMDDLQLTGTNPNLRPSWIKAATADVNAAEVGYTDQLETAKGTFL